jgi:hypothetical protein
MTDLDSEKSTSSLLQFTPLETKKIDEIQIEIDKLEIDETGYEKEFDDDEEECVHVKLTRIINEKIIRICGLIQKQAKMDYKEWSRITSDVFMKNYNGEICYSDLIYIDESINDFIVKNKLDLDSIKA